MISYFKWQVTSDDFNYKLLQVTSDYMWQVTTSDKGKKVTGDYKVTTEKYTYSSYHWS